MEAAAAIAEAAGDAGGAASLYRRIYLEAPRSPEAGPALERLSTLVPAASRFRTEDLLFSGGGKRAPASGDEHGRHRGDQSCFLTDVGVVLAPSRLIPGVAQKPKEARHAHLRTDV